MQWRHDSPYGLPISAWDHTAHGVQHRATPIALPGATKALRKGYCPALLLQGSFACPVHGTVDTSMGAHFGEQLCAQCDSSGL